MTTHKSESEKWFVGFSSVVIVTRDGKRTYSHLPTRVIAEVENLLEEYSDDLVDWKIVAKDEIKKYKKAGIVLRGARYRENMSQKELAKRSGVSQENISRIENGKRQIGEKVAKKLAKPLKIDYTLLLGNYDQ